MPHQPLFEVTRGKIVESVHYGSIAVVDANGKLLSSHGDPQAVAFLRSSAKPFQALPFVERGGVEYFGLTPRELSIACASHEGSDMHVQAVREIQKKVGLEESYLQCGIHMPSDADAFKSLIQNNERPTPNRNNCSGKHSAMLAHAKMRGPPPGKLSGYQSSHPAGYPHLFCRDVPAARGGGGTRYRWLFRTELCRSVIQRGARHGAALRPA